MHANGSAAATGSLGLAVVRSGRVMPVNFRPSSGPTAREVAGDGLPRRGLPDEVNAWRVANFGHLSRGWKRLVVAELARRYTRMPYLLGTLKLKVLRASGEEVDLGLASLRVVTTAGVNFLVDALQGTTEPELLRFHAIGTGTTAESTGQTALVTELTTQYSTDNTRATGTLAEGSAANIFQTVGTNTVDSAVAITEHGILSQAATGGGTLLDRSLFAAVNLANGDSLQTTYELTIPAGG